MAGDEQSFDLNGIQNQFRWSLQALAADPTVQLSLFPDIVCKTDELALDFDHWSQTYLAHFAAESVPAQIGAIGSIDRRLAAMSLGGPLFDVRLWEDEALIAREEWEDLRSMARHALDVLGWSMETPPRGRAIYIEGGSGQLES